MNEPILRPVMPELDSIRGAAILSVLFYHGFYVRLNPTDFSHWQRIFLTATWAGRLGPNLFFVLSGFLITGILLDSSARQDYYKRFYLRRAVRILPVYLTMLGVLASLHYSPPFLVLSLVYLSNLAPLFAVGIAYPVMWSLSVEEHFYFAWPVIVRHVSNRGLIRLTLGVITISPFFRWLSFQYARDFKFNEYTWNSADGLACGALLALLIRLRINDRTFLSRIVYAALFLAALFARFAVMSRQQEMGAAFQVMPWHFLFVAVLGSCLLIGTSNRRGFVQMPILQFFGRISYGLYLFHVLVFVAYDHLTTSNGMWGLTKRFACMFAVATLVAWLSRNYFEERFLRMKNRWSPDSRVPASL